MSDIERVISEDILEGGKRAGNRKWKEWSVVLTGSQLLFLKEVAWVSSLHADPSGVNPVLFKPDEWLSVKDAVALYDLTYDKVRYFRCLLLNVI